MASLTWPTFDLHYSMATYLLLPPPHRWFAIKHWVHLPPNCLLHALFMAWETTLPHASLGIHLVLLWTGPLHLPVFLFFLMEGSISPYQCGCGGGTVDIFLTWCLLPLALGCVTFCSVHHFGASFLPDRVASWAGTVEVVHLCFTCLCLLYTYVLLVYFAHSSFLKLKIKTRNGLFLSTLQS